MFVAGQQFREVKQDFLELLKKILGDKYEDDLQKDLIEEPRGNQISPERFSDVCLRTQCRRAIRKYLIDGDPLVNFFVKVPKLGLPSALNSYLLYDVSLEELDVRDDNNDEYTD